MNAKSGIAIVGNILTDIVKHLDAFPKQGMLANILETSVSVGGCVPNTAINLVKIDSSIPVSAIGMVGNDDNGRYLISKLQSYGINVDKVKLTEEAPTSYTDVMTPRNGDRTFFHKRGANAVFSPEDIDVSALACDIFHIGYILLLDKFDEEDKEYGTKMARLLHSVQNAGIKTSIDVVSDSTADYGKMIKPALKYCNYAIMNEIESCGIWGLNPRNDDGSINVEAIKEAMLKMVEAGVRDKVIIHCKEASFALEADTKAFDIVPSLNIPKEMIKGNVGAGDTFCAGALYGIYSGHTNKQILEFASAAAACNLFASNSVDGVKSKSDILETERKYGRLSL